MLGAHFPAAQYQRIIFSCGVCLPVKTQTLHTSSLPPYHVCGGCDICILYMYLCVICVIYVWYVWHICV